MRSGLVTTNVLACIFKLNFQRVIGFIAKEFGDLERSPISQEVMPFFFYPEHEFSFFDLSRVYPRLTNSSGRRRLFRVQLYKIPYKSSQGSCHDQEPLLRPITTIFFNNGE